MVAENSTPRKRIWQYAFVIGMAACIVAAILVFGMSSFTTILTVFGIVVGLFNAFLGSSGSANEGNWFLSRIKHTLDVSNFLRVATVVVWLAAIGVVTYGVRNYYHEAQKVTLSGRVLTAGGDPAGNARVVILLQNKKEVVTAADGSFTFANLDLSQEPSKKVQVEVVWKNLTMSESVDLVTERQRTINLPPGPPPFRVSYITLEGAAIDLLLQGLIDKRWDERLGGRQFIVPNSVYNSLKNLTKNFSIREEAGEGQSFSVENDKGQPERKSLGAKTLGKSLVGTSDNALIRPASRSELLSLSNPQQPWNVEVYEANPADVMSSLLFWKFASREDISSFQINEPGVPVDKRVDFYEYLTKSSMPADFCLLSVSFGGCAESGVVQLDPRSLKLRVAVLENVSLEPIRIGQFLVHEFSDQTLRPRAEEDALLKSLKAEQQSWFPPETLGPKEKLVIPMDMPMAYPKNPEPPPSSSNTLNAVRRNLAARAVVTIPTDGEGVDLKSGHLLSLLSKPPQNKMLDKEYVFGPSMMVESVIVDNVAYPFRQFDISKLVITSSGDDSGVSEIGSCPFVYTYSAESGEWLNEGHILYGRNSSFKESTDEMQLKRFDGRVIIKEEDPEQSFIDFVYIKVTLIDGREKLLYPLNSKLRFQDGDYLTMRQGDQVELQFDGPPNLFVSSYSIVSRGYYVPYAHSSDQGKYISKKVNRR